MRTLRMLGAVAVLGLVGLLACEGTSPSSPTPFDANRSVAPVNLGADILAMIDAGFPKGLATSIGAKWDQTLRSLAKDPKTTLKGKVVPGSGGRAELTRTIGFIEKKAAESTPPAGETQAHFVARLVLYMSLYVYEGPSAQPPPLTPTSDVAFKLVLPTVTDTVVTTAARAAVIFPAGAVSEPTVVVITPISTYYPENCSGPFDTKICQYPLFYKYNVFPDVKLNVPAHVQVCHVDAPGSNRLPLADHDRFSIAHEAPAAADASAGGKILGKIEVLARVPMTVTACTAGGGTTYTPPIAISSNQGALGALRLSAALAINRVATVLNHAFAPREAFAIDVGVGGLAEAFSIFGVVDTLGVADLAQSTGVDPTPGTPFTVTAPTGPLYAGGTVVVPGWTVTNAGTATSGAFTSSLILSALSNLSAPISATTAVPVDAPTPLAPRALGSYAATTVTLPIGLTPGTYYVGTLISTAGPDAVITNNGASKPITVSPPPNGSISGRVVNAFDQVALPGATVTAGNLSTTSLANGSFSIPNVPTGTTSVTATAPNFVSTSRNGVVVNSGANTAIGTLGLAKLGSPTDIRIVLTWGACFSASNPSATAPCDLDAHLSGPNAGGSRFHVYFGQRSFSDPVSAAALNDDIQNGSGPEITSISRQAEGTYHYYVHNYSESPVITASSARVQVFFGSEETARATFTIPTEGGGNGWDVFTLSGSTITLVNNIITMSPSTVLSSRLAPTGPSSASSALDNDLDQIIRDIVNSPKTTASPSISPIRKP